MGTTSLASSLIILTRRSLPSTRHNHIFLSQSHHHASLRFSPISCTSTSNTNDDDEANSVQAPTITPPPAAVEVRFRRRSRRKSKQERENGANSKAKALEMETAAPKKWEDMTLTEKAIELYVGEKGALFWLNKFAYASIFIMIGAWIVFRFVGPALNLYQLDAPPLSPSDVLKGSSSS